MKTTSKKLIGFIAAAAMTVSLLPANIAFAENYETWTAAANAAQSETDYTYDSASNTYTVNTAKGLAFVAKVVNDGDTDINITLADNIDLLDAGVTEYGEGVTATNSWIPIGDSSNKYIGTFDGAGKSILNLYINTNDSYVGLFGYVGDNGTIKDTTISEGKVANSGIASYAAGFAGNNEGTIENCLNDCDVVSARVPESGEAMSYAAGFAGDNHGTISSCQNYGSIEGNSHSGGIAGTNNYGQILNSENAAEIKGKISGGIAGQNNSPSSESPAVIDRCLNSGNVVGIDSENTYVGGITGQSSGNSSTTVIVKNCVNIGAIGESGNYVGGIVSAGAYTDIINCANAGTLNGGNGGIICMLSDNGNIINCVNTATSTCGIANGLLLSLVKYSYYLQGSASNDIGKNYGTVTGCGTFSLGSDGKYVIDGGGYLVDKLNEYVNSQADVELTQWSGENGGLKLGDYVVIEPTEPEPTPGEVTTSAIAVAENDISEKTLKEKGINTADGVYGENEYGNTISTTFKTTQAISDASMSYGVWTVDLTADGSYVKSTAGKEGAIVTDGENVKNNKGAIYAVDNSDKKEYKLYFDKSKTTILSGEGEVVFGLVIDGLYAPSATAEFEFKDTAPEGATEMTNDNSIFKGAGEDYVHDDSVLHPAQ